jgi:hypothetical protein
MLIERFLMVLGVRNPPSKAVRALVTSPVETLASEKILKFA